MRPAKPGCKEYLLRGRRPGTIVVLRSSHVVDGVFDCGALGGQALLSFVPNPNNIGDRKRSNEPRGKRLDLPFLSSDSNSKGVAAGVLILAAEPFECLLLRIHLALDRYHRVSARTQIQALSAILFLYDKILGRPLGDIDALRAKRPVHERTAPSREEVLALREFVVDRPFLSARLWVDLLYGCGLRVSEPLGTSDQGHTLGRGAFGRARKRRRQRSASAHPRTMPGAVAHADGFCPEHMGDGPARQSQCRRPPAPSTGKEISEGTPGVALVLAFPAKGHCRHPRTGELVRYHILHDRLQQAVREAASKIGMDGVITPHVLRHAYATHSREPIEALRVLMGHSGIETTSGYRHPEVDQATNPLDDLYSERLPAVTLGSRNPSPSVRYLTPWVDKVQRDHFLPQ